MFNYVKNSLSKLIKSRLIVLVVLFALLAGILIQRLYTMQIINGEKYLTDFTMQIKKETTLKSTRGNIYDRDGNAVAYNKLAYNVTYEDVGSYDTTRERNLAMNGSLYQIMKVIEDGGDQVYTNYAIDIGSDGQYEFTREGFNLLRFRADIFGYADTEDLKTDERNCTAEEMMQTLSTKKWYGIDLSVYTEEELQEYGLPSVKAVGENLGEKIFYLTAKTVTRTVAEEAFSVLKGKGLRYKVLTLTAKEKICPLEEAKCNPIECPYAKGHYDRVNEAVFEMLNETEVFDREAIWKQSEKWKVCPYEMTLDLSMWVDAVICDYNYVFDPNARLKRFFGDNIKGEYLFLIDEAHNLVERGRTMYSTSICKEDFLKIKKLVKYGEPKLVSALESCNKQLLELKRECDGCQILNSVSHVYIKLLSLMTKLEEFIEDCKDEVIRKGVLEFYFGIRNFIYIHDRQDENYLIYSELSEEGKFYLHLFCVNPAGCLQEYMGKGNSTILFSATFLPINYYKKLLSAAKDDYAIYAESPFEQSKRLLLLGNDVSTKYTRRGPEMYRKYAEYMMRVIKGRTGNYLAFFPSYRFLEEVWEAFMELPQEQIEVAVQSQYMTEQEREEFLKKFEQERAHSLIGFCVMGGIFSEGIDLTEDKLIGAMIIGTGLPQVCLERELLKYYFDRKNLNGFDYAYLYPGMNKVLQSAGRVIRTDQDRGVIALLDERFMDRRCQEVFPREWNDFQICNSENIEEKIAEFWKEEQMDKR